MPDPVLVPEFAKMLVLSTGHLSVKDATEMESVVDMQLDFPIGIYDKPDIGFFVKVPENALMQSVSGHGQMLPSLLNALMYARSQNCDWIMFDRDGSAIEKLRTYDW